MFGERLLQTVGQQRSKALALTSHAAALPKSRVLTVTVSIIAR
jgi:hypothetical protein